VHARYGSVKPTPEAGSTVRIPQSARGVKQQAPAAAVPVRGGTAQKVRPGPPRRSRRVQARCADSARSQARCQPSGKNRRPTVSVQARTMVNRQRSVACNRSLLVLEGSSSKNVPQAMKNNANPSVRNSKNRRNKAQATRTRYSKHKRKRYQNQYAPGHTANGRWRTWAARAAQRYRQGRKEKVAV